MAIRDVTPEEALQELAADPDLKVLDVRTVREHQSHRIDGSMLLPVQELASRLHELDPDARWLVHCEHGARSVGACRILARAGFRDLLHLSGGLANWMACGLPVVR